MYKIAPQFMLDTTLMTHHPADSLYHHIWTDERVNRMAAAFSAPPQEEQAWQEHANRTINEIVTTRKLNHQTFRRELYGELERRANCDLHNRQVRMQKRLAQAGKTPTEQRNTATYIYVIAQNQTLRVIFDGILREEQAKMF